MKFEVRLVLSVDPEANFIEADLEDMERVMKEIVSSAMYDVDDVLIEECEVEEC